jgi:hypothetical protein
MSTLYLPVARGDPHITVINTYSRTCGCAHTIMHKVKVEEAALAADGKLGFKGDAQTQAKEAEIGTIQGDLAVGEEANKAVRVGPQDAQVLRDNCLSLPFVCMRVLHVLSLSLSLSLTHTHTHTHTIALSISLSLSRSRARSFLSCLSFYICSFHLSETACRDARGVEQAWVHLLVTRRRDR